MPNISKKTLLIALIITVCTASSAAALYWVKKDDKPLSSQSSETTSDDEEQFPGPTEQEKQEANQHKEEVIRRQELEANPPAGQKSVSPVITSAGQNGQEIFAMAYVSGVFENDGSCTYTFTKGSTQITKKVNAFANVSTTDCLRASVNRAEFAEPGVWNLVVTYNSSTAQGASQPQTVTVQ